MQFYSPNEKIKLMRTSLRVNQWELESENMSVGFISMMEIGKRNVSRESSKKLAEKFNLIAKENSIKVELDDEYFYRQPDEDARIYCEQELRKENNHKQLDELIAIATRFQLLDLLAKMHHLNALRYMEEKDNNTAFICLNNCLGIYKELREDKPQANIYDLMGSCKLKLSEYDEAIFYYTQAIAYSIYEDSYDIFFRANLNISNAYSRSKCYKKSIEIIDKNILKRSSIVAAKYVTNARIIKGISLDKLGKRDEALEEYFKLIQEIKGENEKLLALIYNNVGECYYEKGEYNEALGYLSKASIIKNRIDKETLPNTLNIKAKIFFKQGLYEESILIIEMAIRMAERCMKLDILYDNYFDLVTILESRNDIEKVIYYMEEFLNTLKEYDFEKGNKFALYKLSEAYTKNDQLDKAFETIKQLERLL
ncbi:tetratricopeptide repeat protein [Clostridium manihotivorum]|uniref:Uncharacterized protein n=1 Tax=Clostridium manihotivorum TaxID=2320868 RepID=A0A410DQ17_9CLOT|nr:tetratricopeptide repeat protein [Clostridium manihotivorum]QAA31131.1 hypothetical protein C1I91_05320 [Clostridium manihotivorum]